MDDDKKLTNDNEFDSEFDNVNENKTTQNDFDEFNFTDDFPDEFSEEFMKKPNDMQDAAQADKPADAKVEEPFDPDFDFDDDFLPKETFKEQDNKPFDVDTDFDDFNKDIDSNIDNDLDEQSAIPPMQTTEKRGNIFKRHLWISLLILLVLIYGGYKLLQSNNSQEIMPVPTQSKMTPAKVTSQPTNTNGTVEIRQIDDRLDTIEQGMNVLNDQLTQLQGAHVRIEQMEQMVTKIAEEEGGLQDVLSRLEDLNSQVSALNALNQRLSALEAQVGVISSEVDLHVAVSEQTQRAANLSRQAMQAKSMIPVPMVVQAVIPGRAWLMSQTGELITVARGDDVPGYGRVMNIDPVAGTVTMSSETVFREEE